MRIKKISLGLFIIIFLFVQLVGNFGLVEPVYAQMDSAITSVFTGKWAWEKVGKALEGAALGALVQGASYFMRKLAYDTAMYVASGGKGQGALAFSKGPGAYFKDVALDTAAEAINKFSQDALGLNICQPANMQVSINIALGLRQIYGADDKNGSGSNGPGPNCSWQSLKSGATSHWDTVSNPSRMFTKNISVDNTDFGIALGAMGKVDRLQAGAVTAAQTERLEGQGFKSVTTLIGGQVKTPADVVREETTAVTAKHQGELNAGQIAGIYGSGALQIIPMAANVFINTLTSQLLKNILSKGLLPDETAVNGAGGASSGSGVTSFYAATLVDNRKAAENAFNYFFTSVPKKELNVFDLVSSFAACGEPGQNGLYNCVIDSRLQAGLDVARNEPLTIERALSSESGQYLNPDFPLISPLRAVDNQDIENCYVNGYCYSNLQKLIKARVLPLGFEIAAGKADPDYPETWKLGTVVKGFYDCATATSSNGAVVYKVSKDKPYCHLIDPNWVIKVPETRCATAVYGDLVRSGSSERIEDCADWKSCVKEDANGKCIGYGYCTEEKSVWKFANAQKCEPQFSTCKTFVDREGKANSYLSRTVNFGECTVGDLGCRAYSLEKASSTSDIWQQSLTNNTTEINTRLSRKVNFGRNYNLYFNEKISNYTCGAADDGCEAYYRAGITTDVLTGSTTFTNTYKDENLVYLKKAPDYLGCYDTKLPGDIIDWPQTKADLNKLADKPEACNNFAQACLPEEVGCEAYNLKTDSEAPRVPGIVGENYCSKECVGYDTYKQSKTNFEPAVYPLYFVPSLGKTCQPSYQGCSEFVNLDTKAKGGEGLEYYTKIKYCEKPDITNQAVFYTWEGSAKEGYVLRVHKLKTINDDIKRVDIDAGITSQLLTDKKYTFTKSEVVKELVLGSPALVNTDSEHINFTEAENYAYNYALCNQKKYNIRLHEPYNSEAAGTDCRAFYDRSGNIYYRLLSNTITVDASCHPLRKTETSLYVDKSIVDANACSRVRGVWGQVTGQTGEMCQRCYGGGEYGGGYCVYKTIVSESNSCPVTANGCREYVGNTGNRIKTVFFDEFEPVDNSADAFAKAKANWQGDNQQVVAESVQVGLHSLKNDGNTATRVLPTSTLKYGSWYQISFWARGAVQSLEVLLRYQKDGVFKDLAFNPSSTNVSLGDSWREYKIGPIQFNEVQNSSALLVLKRTLATGSSGAYFIDSVRLTELQDRNYLIKETWKTKEGYDAPLACDSDYTDPLPGRALGCKTYVNSDSQDIYLTGFEKLCRDKAVGCTPVYDTYNTVGITGDRGTLVFNALCNLTQTATQTQKCGLTTEGVRYECEVPNGKNSCYIFGPIALANKNKISYDMEEFMWKITPDLASDNDVSVYLSTIIIPEDTPSTTPIYLTNHKSYRCESTKLGCKQVGTEEQFVPVVTSSAFRYSGNYLLDNPTNYKDTLCRADLVGCEQYTNGNNSYFFRNPLVTGNKLCYYRPNTSADGQNYGWYKTDIGHCTNNSTKLCKADDDCGTGDTCDPTSVGNLPCYDDYIRVGGMYDIWSNGTAKYQGFTGTCSAQDNGCSEFIDPNSTSDINPFGEAYYLIDNEQTGGLERCSQASLKKGCVLFNKTELPNKKYNTNLTYALSASKNFELVAPQAAASLAGGTFDILTSNNTNNTNEILKVDPDRRCTEWLACKGGYNYTNDKNQTVPICYELGKCIDTEPNKECTRWAPKETPEILDEEKYINRSVNWGGTDYSGYSLLNSYQIGDLGSILIPSTTTGVKKSYIVYKEEAPSECKTTADNWKVCGGVGRCWQGYCLYPLNGAFPEGFMANSTFTVLDKQLTTSQCKAPPEKDSPFDPEIVKGDVLKPADYITSTSGKRIVLTTPAAGYEQVNYCQGGDCACRYSKTTYKNSIEKDYSTDRLFWPGLDNDGKPCKDGEICNKVAKIETHIGSAGFCLKYDLSRPLPGKGERYACLIWLPLDSAGTGIDVFNNVPQAGYYPPEDSQPGGFGQVYCTDSNTGGNFYETAKYDSSQTVVWSESFFDSNGDIFVNNENGEKHSCNNGPYCLLYPKVTIIGNKNYTPSSFCNLTDINTAYTYFLKFVQNYAPHSNMMNVVTFTRPDVDKNVFWYVPSDIGEQCKTKLKDQNNWYINNKINLLNELDVDQLSFFENNYGINNKHFRLDIDVMTLKSNLNESNNYLYISHTDENKWFEWPAISSLSLPQTAGSNNFWQFAIKSNNPNKTGHTFYGIILETKKMSSGWPEEEGLPGVTYTSITEDEQVKQIAQSIAGNIGASMPKIIYFGYFYFEFDENGILVQNNLIPEVKIHANENDDPEQIAVYSSNPLQLVPELFFVGGTAKLKPKCTEFASVVGEDGENKAKTDLIYKDNKLTFSSDLSVSKDQGNKPFGSLDLGVDVFDTNNKELLSSYFTNKDLDGAFLNCSINSYWSGFGNTHNLEGTAINCKDDYYGLVFSKPTIDGREYLEKMFLQHYKVIYIDKQGILQSGAAGDMWDRKDLSGKNNIKEAVDSSGPPQIYSLNPTNCLNKESLNNVNVSVKHCTVGEVNNITINGKNGLTEVKSYDTDPVISQIELTQDDPLVGMNNYSAVASFFAFADHNRMPIKKVMVDWGDGQVMNENMTGSYLNRKPYCEPNNNPLGECYDKDKKVYTGLTCKKTDDCPVDAKQGCLPYENHFGNSSRACQEGYFEFTHTYNCDKSSIGGADWYTWNQIDSSNMLNILERQKLAGMGVSRNSVTGLCIYKPRVQVRDNWGWCNGVLNTTNYEINPVGIYGDTDQNNCGIDKPNAWTYFKGKIIIVPTE